MSESEAITRRAAKRPDLGLWALVWLSGAGASVAILYFAFVQDALPADWRTPGSLPLYFFGVAGAVLLLVPIVFSFSKRTGHGDRAPAGFVAHVVASIVGTVLIALHTGGVLHRPPALLFLLLLVLVGLGLWARIAGSRQLAGTFGSRKVSFAPVDKARREKFAVIIRDKSAILADLDPNAKEATFSVTLAHWCRAPILSWRYAALARSERRLLGTASWGGVPVQTLTRRLHIAGAYLFVAGLVAHVVLVTVFPDYAARGRPITWWHL